MRTTLRIDDELLKEAKRIAVENEKTLTEVIEDSLRESFARRHVGSIAEDMPLPTFRGTGLQPGINLDDSAGLLDLIDAYEVDRGGQIIGP